MGELHDEKGSDTGRGRSSTRPSPCTAARRLTGDGDVCGASASSSTSAARTRRRPPRSRSRSRSTAGSGDPHPGGVGAPPARPLDPPQLAEVEAGRVLLMGALRQFDGAGDVAGVTLGLDDLAASPSRTGTCRGRRASTASPAASRRRPAPGSPAPSTSGSRRPTRPNIATPARRRGPRALAGRGRGPHPDRRRYRFALGDADWEECRPGRAGARNRPRQWHDHRPADRHRDVPVHRHRGLDAPARAARRRGYGDVLGDHRGIVAARSTPRAGRGRHRGRLPSSSCSRGAPGAIRAAVAAQRALATRAMAGRRRSGCGWGSTPARRASSAATTSASTSTAPRGSRRRPRRPGPGLGGDPALLGDRCRAASGCATSASTGSRTCAARSACTRSMAAACRPTFPPLRTLDRTPNNLPPQLTSFVGRGRGRRPRRAARAAPGS